MNAIIFRNGRVILFYVVSDKYSAIEGIKNMTEAFFFNSNEIIFSFCCEPMYSRGIYNILFRFISHLKRAFFSVQNMPFFKSCFVNFHLLTKIDVTNIREKTKRKKNQKNKNYIHILLHSKKSIFLITTRTLTSM